MMMTGENYIFMELVSLVEAATDYDNYRSSWKLLEWQERGDGDRDVAWYYKRQWHTL